MRVCIVHDYLTHMGGGEKVLVALSQAFPHAPIFTLVYDETSVRLPIDPRRIRTSFLQRFPGAKRSHRYFPLAFMPLAMEQFNIADYDVVISNTHSFGKGIVSSPRSLHISYCMTPTRYAWDGSHRYVREFSSNTWFQRFAPAAISYIRLWDSMASKRVDSYITLSQYVAGRIQKYYGAAAQVVYPPVDTHRFSPSPAPKEYFLVVSRLVPYKRIEIAIRACEQLGVPLLIAGVGPELDALSRIAGPNTTFLGFVPDRQLPALYQNAHALLFPQEEDFGITVIEAAASGVPTIAYGAGGALETVIDGKTGVLFAPQTSDALAAALVKFQGISWDANTLVQHAQKFSYERFIAQVREVVALEWKLFCKRAQIPA